MIRKKEIGYVIKLDESDGNAYSVMAHVSNILKFLNKSDIIETVLEEMCEGDYLNLLKVANMYIGKHVIWETDNEKFISILS